MNTSPVTQWFNELKRIWLEKDIPALKDILGEEFLYYEDPFLSPLTSWDDVENTWQEVLYQDIQKLEITILIDGQTEGSAMYDFAYIDPAGALHESKGSYYLKLDGAGKAVEFRQWWTVQF